MFGSLPDPVDPPNVGGLNDDNSVSSWTHQILLVVLFASHAQLNGTGLSTVNLTTLPNRSSDINPEPEARMMSPFSHPPSSGNPDPWNPRTPILVCNSVSSLHLSTDDIKPGESHVAAGIGSSAM